MRKLVLVGVVVSVLAGCANLQDLNDSLKKTNAALSGATSRPVGQLGDGTGYQPVFNIDMPGGVCNQQAYVDGFKDAYILNWNQFVDTKISLFSAQSRNGVRTAKQNLALYKSRVIGTKGYLGHQMDYKMNLSSFNADNCPYLSYTKGQNGGMEAVAADQKAIVAQEL